MNLRSINITNKPHGIILLCLLFTIVTATPAWGQKEIVFKAKADKNKVSVGERLKVTFSINATGNHFNPPSFPHFAVIGGPNRSTSVRIVNGQVSKKTSYSYILRAQKPGAHKLEPASIKVRGNKLHSNQLTINVVKGNQKQQSQQSTPKKSTAKKKKQSLKEKIKNNLFLRLTVSQTTPYEGEHLVATYKLYTRVDLMNYSLEKMPTLSGFWTQNIKAPKKLNFSRTKYKGKQYNVATIRKVLLFPQKTGELTVDPMEMKAVARVRVKQKKGKGLFNMFFNQHKRVRQQLQSNAVTITVKPLPANAPKTFQGAVGDFSLNAQIDQQQTKANNPLNYSIHISGNGNLKLISPPKLNLSPDIEKYDPKIKDQIQVNASGMQGKRTFDYLLIPRYEGTYNIPVFKFTYFDPSQEEYITKSTQQYRIKVKGRGKKQAIQQGMNQQSIQQVGEDILFIQTGSVDFQKKGDQLFGSPLFYSLLGAPLLLFLGLFGYVWREQRIASDETLLRQRRAKKLARKRLKAAQQRKKDQNEEDFYEEIVKALWGYLGDKLNIAPSELTQEQVAQQLLQHQVKDELVNHLTKTIEQAEFARYATAEEVDMESVYQNAVNIISQLEQHL